MRHCVIAAALMLTTSAPALAQTIDAMRDALDDLPATLLLEQRGDLAYFIDVPVIMELDQEGSTRQPFLRAIPTADIPALNSLSRMEAADWEAKSGVALDALRYFTGYGVPPNVHSHWGLKDETAAADMIEALAGMGFEDAGAPGVVGNGVAREMNPSRRDPSNPWLTMIGAAQFAAAKGSNVIQTQTPEAAALAASDQPSLGDNSILKTALAGLEQSTGNGQIVQAMVISPLFGMTGLDPASLLTPSMNIEETKQRLEEQMAALESGIPPYLGGIVVDVQHEQPGVGIALAYPDCTIAQTAADAIAKRWVEMAGDGAQGEVTAATAEGDDGLCAAAVSVVVEGKGYEPNPAYRAVVDPYFRRLAGVLQIGQN